MLIGKDTRLSGYMFESALEAGFVAAGVNVLLTGPLPTPAVAYMTRQLRCQLGVVISASHNLYEDNGIKFFDGEGAKLSDELEERIEAQLSAVPLTCASRELGRARRAETHAAALPGVLRQRAAAGHGSVGPQDRDRLRQRRGLQGRPAHPGRSRSRYRADRLFAERPQHQ